MNNTNNFSIYFDTLDNWYLDVLKTHDQNGIKEKSHFQCQNKTTTPLVNKTVFDCVAKEKTSESKIAELRFVIFNDQKIVDIDKLVVKSSMQGNGIGSKLLKFVDYVASGYNCDCVKGYMAPIQGKEFQLKKFYTNSGFKIKTDAYGCNSFNKKINPEEVLQGKQFFVAKQTTHNINSFRHQTDEGDCITNTQIFSITEDNNPTILCLEGQEQHSEL